MKLSFLRPCILAVLGAACTLTTLSANILAPGATVSPDTFNSTAGFTLLASITQNVNPSPGSTYFNATYTETVDRDTNNVFCPTCLDFIITVSNAGPGIFERVTTAAFGTFSTDVGYLTPATGVTPASVDRSGGGGVIGFQFLGSGVTAGQTTASLVIETNATMYTSGTVTVQDGVAGFSAGFAPTSVPEPASLFLFGGAALVLGASKKLFGKKA